MLRGPINQANNQRTIATAIAFFIGALLITGIVDWDYKVWGALTIGGIAGIGSMYIAVALYRKWF